MIGKPSLFHRFLNRVAWLDEGTGQGLVYHRAVLGQPPRYNKVNLSLQPASCDCGTNKKDRKVCIHICFAHQKWSVDGKLAIQEYVFEWQQTQHWRAQIAAAGVFEVPTFDDLNLEDNKNEEYFVMSLAVPQPRGRPKTKRCKGRHELIKQAKRKLRMEAASNAHTTATNETPSDEEEPLSDDEELPRSPIPNTVGGPPASNTRQDNSRKAAQIFAILPNSIAPSPTFG